ncbi:cytochrome P450 [Catellatospora sp. IY07-71]|uniref:cytochrome P450 family protein n=1 Tax=Catellatospora sp. IY07-71 TaxID=2728827 RepID=UPI001BB45FFD|nr:cytochrome P450 [Catellatospora sp. IY07-71]
MSTSDGNTMPTATAVPSALVERRLADPYPYFAWLRRHAPALREDKPGGAVVWHVSRYADVRGLLSDRRLSKCPQRVPGYVAGPPGLNRHLVHADPPEHTRLRHLVGSAFIPRHIAALEPLIDTTVRDLIDGLDGRAEIDVVGDFAAPLTFTLICAILGLPERLNTDRTRRLLLATVTPEAARPGPDADGTPAGLIGELIADKRRGGHGESDLLGALVSACGAAGGLTEEELASTAYLLLLVGHDTTMNLIGNGMLALLRHPEQLALLERERVPIRTAVEELLRYDSPVRDATFRVAAEPLTVAGERIEPGHIVSLLIGSANRDPDVFEQPDRVDLARTPNNHLALGHGTHFCIGAALARLQASIAFPLLLRRLGPVRLAVSEDELRWRPTRVMRGLYALPVVRA